VRIADEPEAWPVTASRQAYDGNVVGVRVDTLRADGQTFDREVMTHPGAVAVMAIDDDDQVLVLSQYRHACQRRMIELPAGLLDVSGEPPLEAAKRELREEGGIEADTWEYLLEYAPSPGISTERVQLYLATGVHAAESPDGFTAEHEEASMTRMWVGFDALLAAVMHGQVQNGHTVLGSLVVSRLRHEKSSS
jgi:8-oxo-dGDP phosphatase